jgi:hypothetical protein
LSTPRHAIVIDASTAKDDPAARNVPLPAPGLVPSVVYHAPL